MAKLLANTYQQSGGDHFPYGVEQAYDLLGKANPTRLATDTRERGWGRAKACDLLRPLMRVFPRQSEKLLWYLGAGYKHDPEWQNASPRFRSYFDRQLQCIVTTDVAEWGGRSCYFWGRFWDITHQAVQRKFLSPGDTYIDIGANLGFQSLHAARLVGPSGQVLAFEPNPSTHSILAGHVAINRIPNCRTFPIALGDTKGEVILNQLEEHSGTATLRPKSEPFRTFRVPEERGDDILRDIPFFGKTFVKIDVEGFEQRVLAGLRETLDRISFLSVEVTPEWLEQQGGGAEELYRTMQQAGFRAYVPTIHWRMGLWEGDLELTPADKPRNQQHDALFVRQ